MTSKNPTFIVSNGKGSSYLFHTIIPRDKRYFLNNSKEIRVSLLTGLKTEAIRIAQVLKIKVDFIFEDIRSGNNSMTCVVLIKRELKAHLNLIKANDYNGERVIQGPPPPYLTSKIKLPMEQKLVEDYVTKLKYKDILDFCEDNDLDYVKDDDFPKKHIRKARQNLIKKIGEDIGYYEVAIELSRDILFGHLSDLDFEGFKKFFDFFKIDDSEIMEIYDPQGDMSIEQLVSLLEENNDIIPITKKIGVRGLFASNKNEPEVGDKIDSVEKLWNGLKSKGNHSTDLSKNDVLEEDKSLGEKPGKVQKISKVAEEYFEEMKVSQVWNSKSELEKRTAINKLIEIVGDIGMKVTNKKKAQDERKPFTDADLKKIFDPERYLRETAESSFRYWVPLLGLFTGARINELCQLHVSDIKIVDELWCLDINDDGDSKNSKKLKNKSSARVIPIHPKLIELGLIEFVNHQKNSKVVRLFPELTLRIDGFYRKPGRWFNESYLRKKVGIKDPDKTFHSLRHTVINGLKQKGVGESYISDYVGHSSGESETFGRYGKQYEPIALFEKVVNWIEYRLDVKKLRG